MGDWESKQARRDGKARGRRKPKDWPVHGSWLRTVSVDYGRPSKKLIAKLSQPRQDRPAR